MSRSNTFRLLAVAAFAGACALPVAIADADHWPGYRGGPALAGLQPVDRAIPPVAPFFTRADQNIRTSPVITTATGSDGLARIAYGTETGTVIVRRVDDTGSAASVAAGVAIDDGTDDTDTFTGEGTVGVLKGQGVSLVDSSTEDGLGNLFAVHNDENQSGTDDIAIAIVSEETGSKPGGADFAVPGTDGFTVSSSPILTEADGNGTRTLFFTAHIPCDSTPVIGCDIQPEETRLFKVPIENAQFPDASFGTVSSVAVPSGNQVASPSLVSLADAGNNPTLHVVVPGTAGVVRTYKALDLAAGPVSPDLGDSAQSVSATVGSDGLPASFSDALYVGVGQTGAEADDSTKVYKLTHTAGAGTFSVAGQSNVIGGTPAAALAVAEEAGGSPGRVLVTTGKNFAALDTGDLTAGVKLSFSDNLAPGTNGFSKTTAAAYGGYAYVQRDGGEHLVLDIADAQPLTEPDFTQDPGNADAAIGNGQPAISHGVIAMVSDKGLFAYDASGAVGSDSPILTATAPAAVEGNPLHFTVRLTRASLRTVRVKYTAQGGTATAGADFPATSGVAELPPGETAVGVDIPTTGETIDEGDETVLLVLSEPQHALVGGGGSFSGTIGDDDTTQIAGGDAAVKEGDKGKTPIAMPVRLTGPATIPVRVGYATADEDAKGGVDYDPVVGDVTFEPGETEKLVTVQVRADNAREADERFRLDPLPPEGITLARESGVATITDDDGPAADKRRKPGGLTIEITPLRDVSPPFRFTVRGRLLRPRKMSIKQACSGKVLLELRTADARVAKRVVRLSRKTCRFAGSLQLSKLPKGSSKVKALRVVATFRGNKNLQPVKAPGLLARLD